MTTTSMSGGRRAHGSRDRPSVSSTAVASRRALLALVPDVVDGDDLHVTGSLVRSMMRRMCAFMRPPQPTKPTLMRSLAPRSGSLPTTAPVAHQPRRGPPRRRCAAAPTCLMKSRRVLVSWTVMKALLEADESQSGHTLSSASDAGEQPAVIYYAVRNTTAQIAHETPGVPPGSRPLFGACALVLISVAEGPKHGYAMAQDIERVSGREARPRHSLWRDLAPRGGEIDRTAALRGSPAPVQADFDGRAGAASAPQHPARDDHERHKRGWPMSDERLARALLHLYPRSWRERYGDEFLALVDQSGLTWREVADVVLAAGLERGRTTLALAFADVDPQTGEHTSPREIAAGFADLGGLFAVAGATVWPSEPPAFPILVGYSGTRSPTSGTRAACRSRLAAGSNRLFASSLWFFVAVVLTGGSWLTATALRSSASWHHRNRLLNWLLGIALLCVVLRGACWLGQRYPLAASAEELPNAKSPPGTRCSSCSTCWLFSTIPSSEGFWLFVALVLTCPCGCHSS